MPYRSPARWLAPAALVAAALAVAIVVSGGEESPSSSGTPAVTTARTTTAQSSSKPKRKTYTVKAGDVLSAIAEDTGVTVERLMELNPGVDAQTLQTGQKLRLSR